MHLSVPLLTLRMEFLIQVQFILGELTCRGTLLEQDETKRDARANWPPGIGNCDIISPSATYK